MALLERHRYMIARLAEAFSYEDESKIEQMMLEPECIESIDFFFSVAGPTKIIVTLETMETPIEQTMDSGEVEISYHKLVVIFKELDYVPSTAVYFMKTKRGILQSGFRMSYIQYITLLLYFDFALQLERVVLVKREQRKDSQSIHTR